MALSKEWKEDCLKWRGIVLTGKYAHWCGDYDDLPVDETCSEWPCDCRDALEKELRRLKQERIRRWTINA